MVKEGGGGFNPWMTLMDTRGPFMSLTPTTVGVATHPRHVIGHLGHQRDVDCVAMSVAMSVVEWREGVGWVAERRTQRRAEVDGLSHAQPCKGICHQPLQRPPKRRRLGHQKPFVAAHLGHRECNLRTSHAQGVCGRRCMFGKQRLYLLGSLLQLLDCWTACEQTCILANSFIGGHRVEYF